VQNIFFLKVVLWTFFF